MADYRDDPRWKEYGFGRDMFPGGAAPVASSEYMTADAGDALRRAWGWIKEKGRSETTGPEAMEFGIPDYTPEKGELYKYLESSREDAKRKALEDMERLLRETEERDRLLRETEEYDRTLKDASLDGAGLDSATVAAIEADEAAGIWPEVAGIEELSKVETPDAAPKIDWHGLALKEIADFRGEAPDPFSPMSFEAMMGKNPITAARMAAARKGEVKYIFGKDREPYVLDLKGTWNTREGAAAVEKEMREYHTRNQAGFLEASNLAIAKHKSDLAKMIDDTDSLYGTRAVPTLDERLDVPDVRTYTPDTGEAVSSALLDAVISPAAAAGDVVTEGSPSLIADILAAREGKASGEYAERIAEVDKILETEGTPWTAPISPIHDLGSLFEHDLAVATGKKTIVAGGHAKSETSRIIEDADYSREDIAAALRATGHTMTPEEFLEDHFMKSKATFGDSYIADLAKTAKKGVTSLADFFKDDAPGTEVTDRAREILSDFKWKSSLPTTLLGSDADSSLPMVGMAGAVVPAIDFIKKHGPLLASTHGELPARYLDISPVDASFRAGGLAKYALGAGSLGGGLMAHSAPLGVGSDVPLDPYADPYPSMIDPTFVPDASIHYSDPLKHYDTETVPGHLPLSLTTPFTTAVEGWEHAAEFAPPEWSDPAMPPPSDYSYPGFIPSSPFGTAPYSPPGYSPITGTFYPTAAEIIAAGGGELFTEPSPLMIP